MMSTSHQSRRFIPWTAYDELLTRRIVILDWVAVWLFLLLMMWVLSRRDYLEALVAFCPLVFFALDMAHQRRKLAAMLENKPRSTAALTEWIQLRPWQTEICCQCGVIVHIEGAPWYPNSVDAGGGRYAILCPCGVGYFKLKETKQ